MFCACAIAYGIYFAAGGSDDEAKVLQSFFLVDVALRLANQCTITNADVRVLANRTGGGLRAEISLPVAMIAEGIDKQKNKRRPDQPPKREARRAVATCEVTRSGAPDSDKGAVE